MTRKQDFGSELAGRHNAGYGSDNQQRQGQGQAQRIAVLVVGMHRSGTSALTGALGELGVAMPKHLLGADENNPTGHWESEPLVDLNDRILAEAGSRWDDWRSFDTESLEVEVLSCFKAEIASLILQEFGDAPIFALKDPRICRMVPLYQEVLISLGIQPRYVLVYRNPQAVIASLAKRDRMTSGFAELMWLRHVLDAEAATRDHARSIQSYEAFLADWRSDAGRMAQELKLDWPDPIETSGARVDRLLSQKFNHHSSNDAEPSGSDELTNLVKDAHRSLHALAANGNDAQARSALDRVKRELDAAVAVLGNATFPELAAREQRLAGLADIRQYHIDRLVSENAAKDEVIEALHNSTSWRLTQPIRSVVSLLRN